MKRVFFCAHTDFPKGDAAANYIENFALALLNKGYEVYVFSRGNNYETDWNRLKQCYQHNGIFYMNAQINGNSIAGLTQNYFREGRFVIEQLNRLEANEQDQLIFYSINYFYIKVIYEYGKEKKIKSSMIITEWHQFYQYMFGFLNPKFWLDKMGFSLGVPMSGRVIVISKELEKNFKKRGCMTLRVPPLCGKALKVDRMAERSDDGIRNFIYSGNSLRKDAVNMIIKAFAALSDEELEKVRLHFTGMSAKTVAGLKRMCRDAYHRVERILVIYDWMSYDALIDIYKKMDFLILLRKENKVTISNFPSKVPEMMRYGIIPVVSRVGDYTENYLVDGMNCVMVNSFDINDSKSAIRKAVNMTEAGMREIKKHIFETVENDFYYRNWSERISKFLEEQ